MAHLEQELEILREELRQVRDLTKAQFKQNPYVPNVIPNSPPVVRTAPNFSIPTQVDTMPTNPEMQHILGSHIATSYETHTPHVYAVEAPAFIEPVTIRVPYEVDQYAEMEKDVE
ncbi:hypothetical protein HAX54_012325 [Datura stramonium]|uniref:Uncharacterized protein n=1 Tax=Datura stramonium TaxID=4076 RepID=A0ABS8Y5E0_DATST|nr:hypothetical protein [Datura stramonium]